jgi:hypothetical protein
VLRDTTGHDAIGGDVLNRRFVVGGEHLADRFIGGALNVRHHPLDRLPGRGEHRQAVGPAMRVGELREILE